VINYYKTYISCASTPLPLLCVNGAKYFIANDFTVADVSLLIIYNDVCVCHGQKLLDFDSAVEEPTGALFIAIVHIVRTPEISCSSDSRFS